MILADLSIRKLNVTVMWWDVDIGGKFSCLVCVTRLVTLVLMVSNTQGDGARHPLDRVPRDRLA